MLCWLAGLALARTVGRLMMEEVSLTKVQHVQLLAIVTALLLMRDTEPGVYNGRVVACEADELIAECEHLVFPLLPKREVGWL